MLKKVTIIKLQSKKEGVDIMDAFETLIKNSKSKSWPRSKQLSMSHAQLDQPRKNCNLSKSFSSTSPAPIRVSKEDL